MLVCFLAAACQSVAAPQNRPLPATQTSEVVKTSEVRTSAPTPAPLHLALSLTPSSTAAPARLICSPLAVQPLDKIREIVTQPFIMPRSLAGGLYSDDAHHGVDLGYYTRGGLKFTGTAVLAALDGKIAAVIHDRPPYGNMLILETTFENLPAAIIASQKIPAGDSLYTLYAHLQALQPLKIGDRVRCGQQLAETGLTGFTGGPHLHFETRWGQAGATFASMGYYRADMTAAEMENYRLWRMSGQFHLFDPLDLLSPKPAAATPTPTPAPSRSTP